MNLMLAIILYLIIGYVFACLIDIRIRRSTGCGIVGIKEYAIVSLVWPVILLLAAVGIVVKGGAK